MKKLIWEAQRGSRRARTQLAAALRPRLTSMARYYARRCGLDYEDLLQEAWCAVFEALPETRLQIGSPEQFLLHRARWAVLDYLKWSNRRQMDSLEDDYETPCRGEEDDSVVRLAVEEAAETLTPVQRNVLELLLAGNTCTAAAQKLGCTTANVSYHLGQVRRHVAAVL